MKNFCTHPWTGMDIDAQGNIRPCCKYIEPLENNIDEYFTSKKLESLRTDFLNDLRPAGCVRCWNDEDAGLPSKRILDKEYRLNEVCDDSKIHTLTLSMGNTCNLACQTCSSYASSKWINDEKKLKNKFNITVRSHNKFYKNPKFINSIKEISKNLIDITFIGGEPFMAGISEQHEILDYLIQGDPSKITLTYNTNTTIFPDETFWTKWKYFKKVNLTLSIDGIGERFEYLRWPANWDTCYQNIKKYQEFVKQFQNIQLSVSHTVSIFNVLYLNEFFIWCFKEKLPEPYIGMVEIPSQYNIKNLPESVKIKIQEKLTSKKLISVANFMHGSAVDSSINFLNWVKEIDLIRNQKFETVFPELANLLTE